MFKAPKRVVYHVPDIEKAKRWYGEILNADPIFDSPMVVVFLVEGTALFLSPQAGSAMEERGTMVYWEVDNAILSHQRLLESGAAPQSEVTTAYGKQTASVKDPFGNIIGIESAVDESQKTVEHKPSDTARGVAFLRALATMDEREEIRGGDYLAEIFLAEDPKRALKNPAAREWMKKNFFPPGIYEYLIARTAYFDGIMEEALRESIPQIVFLGAGYDSRPYRFSGLIQDTRIFEVDAPTTQEHKRSLLAQSAIAIPNRLVFVTVDFKKDSLRDALLAAGFSRDKRTLYLWEGVTYYLPGEAVDETLRFIRENSPSGSSVGFDYHCSFPGMEDVSSVREWRKFHKTHSPGEPIVFGIEKDRIESFLSQRGFTLVDHLDAKEMEKRFLTLKDGSCAGEVIAIECIAQAQVR